MEKISALMDGELEPSEAASVVPVLKQRDELREAWSTYHLIGDALRGQRCFDCGVAGAVTGKLVQEPTVLAPRVSNRERIGRRWALPSLAAAAAVATVTWMSLETQQGSLAPQIAIPASHLLPAGHIVMPSVATADPMHDVMQIGTFAPAQQPTPPIQLSARGLHPYLMAHQEFSPSTTIQGLAPYVRTVSSQFPER